MPKKYLRLITSILSLLVIISIVTSCSVSNPIVGLWKDVRTGDKIEFLSDGKIILDLKTEGVLITGEYELLSDNYMSVELEGFIGGLMSLFQQNTWRYKIEDNILTLSIGDNDTEFEKQ